MLNSHGILHPGLLINKFSSKVKCVVFSVCCQKEPHIIRNRSESSDARLDTIFKRFSTETVFIFKLNMRSLTRNVYLDVFITRN